MKTLILFLLFTAVIFGQPKSGIKVPLPTQAPTLIIGQSSNNAYDGVSLANFRDTVGIGWKSAKDYGIAGDSTDESTDFSTMLADLSSGDVLYIPTGNYLIPSVEDTITVPVTLIGDGLKNTRIYKGKFIFTREVQLQGISFEDVTGSAVTINPTETLENITIRECGFMRNTFRGVDFPIATADTVFNIHLLNNITDGGGVGKAFVYIRCSYKRIVISGNIVGNLLNYGILVGDEYQDATVGQVVIANNIIYSITNATSGEAHGIFVVGNDVIIANNTVRDVWNDDDTDSEGIYWKANRALCYGNLLHNAGYGDGAIASKGALPASDFYTNDVSIISNTITYDRPPRVGRVPGIYANTATLIANNKIQGDTTGIDGISVKSATGDISVTDNSVQVRDGLCLNIDMNTNGNDTTVNVIVSGEYKSENKGIQFNANYGVDYIVLDKYIVDVDSGFAIEYLGAGELFKIGKGIIRSNTRTGSTSTIFIDGGMERVVIDGLDMFIGSAQTFKPLQLRANINKVINTDFYYSGDVVSILQIDSGTPSLSKIDNTEFIVEDGATDAPTYFIQIASNTGILKITNTDFLSDDDDDSTTIAVYSDADITDLIATDNFINASVDDFLLVVTGKTVTDLELTDNTWEGSGEFYNKDGTVTNEWIYDNPGYVTSNSGTATLVNGNTSIAVAHGLDITPLAKNISVTPIETLASASFWWVDTIGATNITINVNADPTQDVDFVFQIIDKGER